MNVIEVQKKVLPEIEGLLKKEPESISLIAKTEKGWTIHCDILEKKSIPETYDLLKVFEFNLDENADIIDFKQLKKVRRGALD